MSDKPVAPLLQLSGWRSIDPKVALHPSMTDYYDTCKYLKEQLSRNQAILNHQQQSGSTSEVELRTLESAKRNLEEELNSTSTQLPKRESTIRLQQRDASHSGLSSSDLPISPDRPGVRERSYRVHNTVSPWPSVPTISSPSWYHRGERVNSRDWPTTYRRSPTTF
jgi:hypothetical protein